MKNLNDLIWTDEDSDDGISPQDVNMRPICMIAFCGGGGMDSAGPSGFACGSEWTYKTAACS